MNEQQRIHDALEAIAKDAVPDRTTLWPAIREKMVAERQSFPARVSQASQTARERFPSLQLGVAVGALAVLLVTGILTAGGFLYLRERMRQQAGSQPVIAMLTEQPTSEASAPAVPLATATLDAAQPVFAVTATPGLFAPPTPTPTVNVGMAQQPTQELRPTSLPPLPIAPTLTPTAAIGRPQALAAGGQEVLSEQTINGVTVAIQWAYLDEARLAFQYTVSGLPAISGGDFSQAVRAGPLTSSRPVVTGLVDNSLSQAEMSTYESVMEETTGGKNTTTLTVTELRSLPLDADEGDLVDLALDIMVGGAQVAVRNTHPDGTQSIESWVDLPDTGTFHFDIRVAYIPSILIQPGQMVEANGLKMELREMRVSPAVTEVEVCFFPPAGKVWQLGETATLQVGPTEPQPAHIEAERQPAADGRTCLRAAFAAFHDRKPASAVLSIPRLSTVPDYTGRFEAAKTLLAAEGIEVEQAAGEVRITRKPETMSAEAAHQKLLDAVREYYPGPWLFVVPVPGK